MICQDNVPLMPSSPFTQEKGSLCVCVRESGETGVIFACVLACVGVCVHETAECVLLWQPLGHTCEWHGVGIARVSGLGSGCE